MALKIRKIVTCDEENLIEGFKETKKQLKLFSVADVIENLWSGRYVSHLKEFGRDVDNPASL